MRPAELAPAEVSDGDRVWAICAVAASINSVDPAIGYAAEHAMFTAGRIAKRGREPNPAGQTSWYQSYPEIVEAGST